MLPVPCSSRGFRAPPRNKNLLWLQEFSERSPFLPFPQPGRGESGTARTTCVALLAPAFFPGQLRQCDSQDTVAKLSPDLFVIDRHWQAQAADEVASATLAAVKVPCGRDALKRPLTLQ